MYAFQFASYFPTLAQSDFDQANLDVTTNFAGVSGLWNILNATTAQSKRDLCYQYLTAWYLADMNPTAVSGIQASGGMPLTSKSIDGVSVSFSEVVVQDGLKQLTSNVFGMKALQLLISAPERMGIYG